MQKRRLTYSKKLVCGYYYYGVAMEPKCFDYIIYIGMYHMPFNIIIIFRIR